ncbi:MAG TPA: sensor histidine kinase [Solirubrobacter sp.]|nr:sensor histidine kinase [Solirubrobacter sp.]
MLSRSGRPAPTYIPLFWRLFVPNAAVLLGAGIVLMIQPANGRVLVLAGGLAVLLSVNLVLMRRAFAPLSRLTTLMNAIDPLDPGRRLPALGPESEVTRLTEAFNRMLDRLETERRESGFRALVAEEAERRRVAGELHDEIGQRLTALLLQIDRLARAAPPELGDEFATTLAATKETLEGVRGLARRLRPEVLDELGLVPALRNLCDRIQDGTGLVIRRTLDRELPALSPDAELVIYRVAQEALTNVVRHADCGEAEVTLGAGDGEIELVVHDGGVGVAQRTAEGSSGGIRGMRERALLIGARLEVLPADGRGTDVRLHVQMPQP